MIRNLTLQESDLLVSFDVKSLFTRVPITEVLQVAHSKLVNDETLEDCTVMTPSTTCELAQMCMDSTYFAFKDCLYEQIERSSNGVPPFSNPC